MFLDFWKKQDSYFEHADVEFTGNIVIAVLDSQGNSGIYSSSKEINDMEADAWLGGVPFISIRRFYNNKDRKIEKFRMTIDLPGVDPQTVRNIQILTSFEYLLTQKL